MALATQTGTNRYGVRGDKNEVSANFSAIADTNTWDSGLKTVDGYSLMIEEAAAAADSLSAASISAGVFTFGVAGTIAGARVTAWGW